jgi:hypothetical protein
VTKRARTAGPTTQPRLPDGDAPLDRTSLDTLLRSFGDGTVLVGGQALAFWMDRYGIEPEGAVVTNDGDVLGTADDAERIAKALRAALVRPTERALTSLVAQIRIPVADGRLRNVDLLHLLYTVGGPRKSREFTEAVVRDSVLVEWKRGQCIRMMHPLHVLDSRVQNAVGLLAEKGPHVVTQAVWAIEVARAAILRVLGRPGEHDRVGAMVQQVYTLARSRAGRQLLRERGIETLKAIPIDEIIAQAPQHERQLNSVQRALAARARRVALERP